MKLDRAVSIVTGASRGIGRAVAESLASRGAVVVLAARTAADLENAHQSIRSAGGESIVVPTDVTDRGQVEHLFSTVEKNFGRLDILINNAGIGRFSPVKDLSLDDFDAMWNLNMRGLFLCTQRAVRMMEAQRQGVIVNVSSLAGKNAFVGGAGYAATKWALMGFAKCLLLEVREHNIKVITVCPGSVDTSFSSHPRQTDRADKILYPQDVADTILSALEMPDRAMVSEIDIRPTNPK